MKLRKHRGALQASMATLIEIDANMPALAAAIRADGLPDTSITVTPYGFDPRIGWDTHLVTIEGHGVYGFTDGPVSGSERTH